MTMKNILIAVLFLTIASLAKGQGFPNTDSLRTYNIKYITNNPATAFTNLRLHTLIRGVIDWIDTARAGTGGGGAIGIDTLYALNDSTIRYRRNGVFHNAIIKGVYDTRHKVDTIYKSNDTTLNFTVNGIVRSLVLTGSARNLSNAALTANGNYNHNWAQHYLSFDSVYAFKVERYAPDAIFPTLPFNNFIRMDSTINQYPFRAHWSLGYTDASPDSIWWDFGSTRTGSFLYNVGPNGYGLWDFVGNVTSPKLTGTLFGGSKLSTYQFGHTAILKPADSILLKAVPAATADSILAVRAFASGTNTVIKIPASSITGSPFSTSNIGSGYRLAKTPSGQIKTWFFGYGTVGDSTTNTDGITIRADTSSTNHVVTQSDLNDAVAGAAGSPAGSNTQIQYNNSGAFGAEAAFTYNATTNKLTTDNINLNGLTASRPLKLNGSKDIVSTQIDLASTNDVTGLLPEDNMQVFKTYPAEHQIGTIFERNKWDGATMAAEFSNVNGTSIALNGDYPRSTSATVAWNTFHRLFPNRPLLLPKWSYTVEFQIVSALASNIGFGPAIRSNNINGANFGYGTYLACFSSTGTPHLAKEDGSADQTNGTFTVSQGDVIRMTLSLNDSVMTLVSQNITTSSSVVTITKTFVAGTAPYVPNTGTLGFQNFSGTYEIRYIKFSSNATASPNIAVAGDSKEQIISTTFAGRSPSQLNANYPTVLNYSGAGDQLKDLIDKKEEVLRINPEQWWILLGSNDLRYGNSLAVTMERMRTIKSWFTGSSTRVYWSVIPEDSTGGGIGLSAFKQSLAAEAGANYIDLWTGMSSSNILSGTYNSGDGVHPNQAGQNQIYTLGVASGLLTVISPNRRSPYQKFGGGIAAVGDSLTTTYKLERAANNVPMFDDSLNMKPSFIYHDATKLMISNNLSQATHFTGALVDIDGMVAMGGPAASFIWRDRNNPSNHHGMYSQNNVMRFLYNGADHSYINASGQWKIGEDNATTIASTFHIRKSRSIIDNGITGIGFALDTATYTLSTGGYAFFSHASIASPLITAPSTSSYTDAATLYVGGEPRATGSLTITRPWSLYVVNKTRLGTTDSAGTATGGYLFKDAVTGEVKVGPGGSSSVGYQAYTALLTQSGTGDPTATVLGTNGIGAIVWTRNSAGNYTGTLTGAFTANKTWLICQKGDGSGSFVNGLLSRSSANALTLDVRDNTAAVQDNFTNMSIEVRVYP